MSKKKKREDKGAPVEKESDDFEEEFEEEFDDWEDDFEDEPPSKGQHNPHRRNGHSFRFDSNH